MKKLDIGSVFFATVLAVIVGYAGIAGAEKPSSMEKLVSVAKTKADHEAIVAGYEKAAADATVEEKKHRNLASFYHGSPIGRGEGTHGSASHCENLASLYKKAAEENMALAKAHKEAAEDMK